MASQPLTDDELQAEIDNAERLLADAQARYQNYSDRLAAGDKPSEFFEAMVTLENDAVQTAKRRLEIAERQRDAQ
jgi:hypothetical protein